PAPAPAPAPAPKPAPAPSGEVWVDVATGLCLDGNGNGDMYTLGCNDGDYQRWIISASGDGVRVRSAFTGRCIGSHANGSSPSGARYRGTVYAAACDGGAAQVWTRTSESQGYVFRNAATGECLDSDASGGLYTQDYNGGNYQHWVRR
ncbi:ricin-type beta-trefoil lectin domain protein, partial [Frankia sp. AgKG'84/4]|uniref:RICIN domain-containing protein n=1 Tax=Frankia sp. AgKG'84/4 TaxID=573490 RepID=UPI002029B9BD